jgi:phospholipase C
MGMTRRDALKGLGVAAGAIALGCGDNESALGPDDPDAAAGGPDAGQPGGPDAAAGGPDADPPADARPPDLTPEQLLAGIDTIVVLCMENRSFDHLLGSLRLVEGRTDVDGLTGIEVNLDPEGNPVQVFKLEDFTPEDPPHGWESVHAQWNEGRNDGFVTEHAGASQNEVMGYHTRDQLPVTYALADYGVVCNKWFCSVLGPTWPNRMYLHGGTSMGRTGNIPPPRKLETVWDQLTDAGKTGTNYHHGVPWLTGVRLLDNPANPKNISQFFVDAAAGTLPSFVMIDPQFFGDGANDDHPDNDIRLGQALIGTVFAALAASPQWNKCLFVLTYDEHGGFYDHVAPPVAVDDQADFGRMGFRVPSIVIGPTVRRRAAVNTVFDHTSVISTVKIRHGLPGLTARSQNASPLSPCIDPTFVDNPQSPPTLPTVVIPRAELEQRLARGGVRPDQHPELQAALGTLPSTEELNDATRSVLAWGEKLGVVKLV